jgi:hypothetical protein
VLLNQPVPASKSEPQEIQLNAVDAKHATGHEKFQIQHRPHVSQDHWLDATVYREETTKDILALIAQSDKSQTQQIQAPVLTQSDVNRTKFNKESTKIHAVDALPVTSQVRFQTNREHYASTDHSLLAQTALRDNQMTDTHV